MPTFTRIFNVSLFQAKSLAQHNAAQQSVHLTLGILAKISGIFHALSFFWLDGFAVHCPSAGNAIR
jgi:hypothetical protein